MIKAINYIKFTCHINKVQQIYMPDYVNNDIYIGIILIEMERYILALIYGWYILILIDGWFLIDWAYIIKTWIMEHWDKMIF